MSIGQQHARDKMTSPEPGSNPTPDGRLPARRMVAATLSGQHEFATERGEKVQIWLRQGRYLARGRCEGQQFGVTLDMDAAAASHELRRLVTELENGTFVPRTRGGRQLRRPIPRHDLRSLIDAFLDDRRRTVSASTAGTYHSRLMHVLDFAEQALVRKKWRLAADVDRTFAVRLREFLFDRDVTRNGRVGGTVRKMSPKMVRLCLETLRGVLSWALRADVRHLPVEFINPITREILGPKPTKDPLRSNPVPLQARILMVRKMDGWQLLHLSPLLVVPTRFDDVAGAVISDFDLDRGVWHLGSRIDGNDHNKGRVTLQMPLPDVLSALLRCTTAGRTDGPMFRSRRACAGGSRARLGFQSPAEFEDLCQAAIGRAKASEVSTEQGRKSVIRSLLRQCGAVTTDVIERELKQLFASTGVPGTRQPYDVRAAVTTDMNQAGLRHLELRYLTMYSVNDILNEYVSLDPVREMAKYFAFIAPLLEAIRHRAAELQLPVFETDCSCRPAAASVGSKPVGCQAC